MMSSYWFALNHSYNSGRMRRSSPFAGFETMAADLPCTQDGLVPMSKRRLYRIVAKSCCHNANQNAQSAAPGKLGNRGSVSTDSSAYSIKTVHEKLAVTLGAQDRRLDALDAGETKIR